MTICVVSNKRDVARQYSDFVDSCDRVMRISKMDNLDTGLTGRRTDLLLVSLHPAYFAFSRANRHVDLFKKVPRIAFFPDLDGMARKFAAEEGLENWELLPDEVFQQSRGMTACGTGVRWARYLFPDARIYFLGDVDAWKRTPSNGGGHACEAENAYLQQLIREGILVPILEEDKADASGLYSRPLNREEALRAEREIEAFGTDRTREYALEISHPQWKDVLRVRDGAAFRVSGSDGADVLRFDDRELLLRWKRWGVELFVRQEKNRYVWARESDRQECFFPVFYDRMAVVPAKGVSERCPGKNLRLLAGEPLFLHSVLYARQEGFTPVVSTDSDEVMALCRKRNIAFVQETVDDSRMENCLQQVLRRYACNVLAVLQPTSPLRERGMLKRMGDAVAREGQPVYTSWKIKLIGHLDGAFQHACREQDAKRFFHFFDGSVVVVRESAFRRTGRLFNDEARPWPNVFPCTLQIDTEEEFRALAQLCSSAAYRDGFLPAGRLDVSVSAAPADSLKTAEEERAETFSLRHPEWNDEFVVCRDRGKRRSRPDEATILKRDEDGFLIRWDRWGVEQFRREGEKTYRFVPYRHEETPASECAEETELLVNPHDGGGSAFRRLNRPFVGLGYEQWDYVLLLDRMEDDVQACVDRMPRLRSVLLTGMCKDSLAALVLARRLKRRNPRLRVGVWGCAWAGDFSGESPVYRGVVISPAHARYSVSDPRRKLLARLGDPLALARETRERGFPVHLFSFYAKNAKWMLDAEAALRLRAFVSKYYVWEAEEEESLAQVHGKILHLCQKEPGLIQRWVDEMFHVLATTSPDDRLKTETMAAAASQPAPA